MKEHWRQRLLELLVLLGINQAAFAEATGISPDYVSRLLYEPGKLGGKSLGPTTMSKIRQAYGLAPGWFDLPLGAAMPSGASVGETAARYVVDQTSALTDAVRMRWPFRLVSYERLVELRRSLGPRTGPQALNDIDKQLEGVVLKWEREIEQKKSQVRRRKRSHLSISHPQASRIMRIRCSIKAPPSQGHSWDERWEGPDRGMICAWLTGIERAKSKRESEQELVKRALAGELPVLPWKGGVERSLVSKTKLGSHLYVATWRGLRGEDLDIDDERDLRLTCSRTSVTVTFTSDVKRLLAAGTQESVEGD